MPDPHDLKARIAGEIYTALERLGADAELLSIVGRWRGMLRDEEVLLLEDYNTIWKALHHPYDRSSRPALRPQGRRAGGTGVAHRSRGRLDF
jgi:hypothetical protein